LVWFVVVFGRCSVGLVITGGGNGGVTDKPLIGRTRSLTFCPITSPTASVTSVTLFGIRTVIFCPTRPITVSVTSDTLFGYEIRYILSNQITDSVVDTINEVTEPYVIGPVVVRTESRRAS
jgi:hypothetical protein